MVCNRCIIVVKQVLETLKLPYTDIDLGEVVIATTLTKEKKLLLSQKLANVGFELIDDKGSKLIEKIKTLIISLVQDRDNELQINLSDYLSQTLHQDYHALSSQFSSIEGITIEKYYILQKIERVKELLVYGELSLSEIAYQMNYSSTAHLSSQFKKVTGLTPSHFKKIKDNKRKPLDQL
jgi:AraC-like DNA-binding protein